MSAVESAVLCYFCIVNISGFFMMGVDKWKAKNRRWRIAEKTFFLVGIIGGSLGCWLGMYVFRHKTLHWYFVVGMPLIFVIQAVLILIITFNFALVRN